MMSEKKPDIMLSNNKALSSYSSEIIKKGIDLANKLTLSKLECSSFDMSAEGYYKAGISKKDQRNYQEALENFDRAIILDKTHDCAYIERGDIYKEIGDIQRAIEDYTQALNIDSDYYTFLKRGDIFLELGDFQSALDDYSSALEVDEYNFQDEDIYIKRGCTHVFLNKDAEAIVDFYTAFNIDTTAFNIDTYFSDLAFEEVQDLLKKYQKPDKIKKKLRYFLVCQRHFL